MVDDDAGEVERYLHEMAEQLAAEKGSYPEPASKESEFKWAKEIKDEGSPRIQIATGYMPLPHIGIPKVPLRTWVNIALFAQSEGLSAVSEYLWFRAGVLPRTSLSEKGFLVSVPGTVKRKSVTSGSPKTTRKSSLFGGETEVKEGGDLG